MEVVIIMQLFIIAIELVLIFQKITTPKEVEKEKPKTRRDVEGVFANPLGDSYRRNTKHQYVPILPNSKMLTGDEEEDEV